MKRVSWIFVALIFGCGNKVLDPFDADSFRQFSSTVTVESAGGTMVYDYYRDGNKLRIDPRVPADNDKHDRRMTIIVDLEKRTTTAISMGRKQFFEQSLDPKSSVAALASFWPKVLSRESVGSETIDGHVCAIERVMMQGHDGVQRTAKVWTARDLQGFAVKYEVAQGNAPMTVKFGAVKLGPVQDRSLFAIPSGFTNAAGG
jgi:hypothetical protein